MKPNPREAEYQRLWHVLRRIELGIHEDGGPITREVMIGMASIALNHVRVPAEILEGYER